jgi:hypothetical protein
VNASAWTAAFACSPSKALYGKFQRAGRVPGAFLILH